MLWISITICPYLIDPLIIMIVFASSQHIEYENWLRHKIRTGSRTKIIEVWEHSAWKCHLHSPWWVDHVLSWHQDWWTCLLWKHPLWRSSPGSTKVNLLLKDMFCNIDNKIFQISQYFNLSLLLTEFKIIFDNSCMQIQGLAHLYFQANEGLNSLHQC